MTARQAFTLWLTLPAVHGRTHDHRNAELDWLLHAMDLEDSGRHAGARRLARVVIEEARRPLG